MRCQGPRESKAGYCLNIVITLRFEWVQQRHLCKTNVTWVALAVKSGDPHLDS